MNGFGSNYYPVEETPYSQLDNGDYIARIKKVELKTYQSGDEYADITVDIQGHPDAKPDHFTLNSAPVLGAMKANGQPVTKDDVDKTNGRLTRFFKSFGIKDGDFDLNNWKGKVGTVHCDWQYDKTQEDKKSKQYKALTPILPRNQKQSAAVDSAKGIVSQVAKAVGGTVETSSEKSPEVIIF